MTGSLVIVGDVLLDRDIDGTVDRFAPDAPVPVVDQTSECARPGGAGLAALLAARDGLETTLITALSTDPCGEVLGRLLDDEGVTVIDLGTTAQTSEKTRIRSQGRPLVRLDRGGGPGEIGKATSAAREAIHGAGTILVSDYGRGISAESTVRELVAKEATRTPLVWDPHPRGAPPVAGTRVLTPNSSEASLFAPGIEGDGIRSLQDRARRMIEQWSLFGVAVTMGRRGALFVDGGAHPLMVPAPQADASDSCGAGDRFAVSVAKWLTAGELPSEATTRAVMESARFVATGGAGGIPMPKPSPPDRPTDESAASRLAGLVRERGGIVVATGGCFDLIHPGHVALLEAARNLGDCLIVCLNSDMSIRDLKGPGRPVNACADRSAVLTSLSSVDAVEVFDGTTPHEALRRIKPHLWVKGGDYGSDELPEAGLVESWGGEVVILPYMKGHSTSGMLDRVRR